MIKSTSKQFGKVLYILYPGDYFATRDDCILGTVTGSCVAVCLYDSVRRIGGMGHFIVPGAVGTEGIYRDQIASHGITSMEYIIGEIVKLGGDRKYLRAKIFGASYLQDDESKIHGVSLGTMRFMHEYFTVEKIPVEVDDLGGNARRKLYFIPTTGRVFRKVLRHNEESSEFVRLEREYIERAFEKRGTYGKVILFE